MSFLFHQDRLQGGWLRSNAQQGGKEFVFLEENGNLQVRKQWQPLEGNGGQITARKEGRIAIGASYRQIEQFPPLQAQVDGMDRVAAPIGLNQGMPVPAAGQQVEDFLWKRMIAQITHWRPCLRAE
jgi:hypothetical protein